MLAGFPEGTGVAMNLSIASVERGLMGLSKPNKGYSGMVQVGNQQVQVNSGVTVIQGKKFLVSDKGQVTDETGQQIGNVQNGQFVPAQQQQMQTGAQP